MGRRGVRLLAIALALVAVIAVPVTAGADDDGGGRNFIARLSGANEVPPVDSASSGKATFKANGDYTEVRFKLRVRNTETLLGAAGAHIHCGPAGENGPVAAFLAGVVPGGLDGKVEIRATLTDQNVLATDCGSTLAELVASMRAGDTYVNVHSLDYPAGEVRGQIYPRGGGDD